MNLLSDHNKRPRRVEVRKRENEGSGLIFILLADEARALACAEAIEAVTRRGYLRYARAIKSVSQIRKMLKGIRSNGSDLRASDNFTVSRIDGPTVHRFEHNYRSWHYAPDLRKETV